MDKPRRRNDFIDRRIEMGFTQESLAAALDMSTRAVEAWEAGARTPGPKIRPRLAELLQVSLPGLEILLSADGAKILTHEVQPGLTVYDSLVQGSGCLEMFTRLGIPGMLQTRPYARAVESLGRPPTPTPRANELADYRLARQVALERSSNPLQLRAVLFFSVLIDEVGGREVTLDQIEHLAIMADRPNVEILILPPEGEGLYCPSDYELLYRSQVDGSIEPKPFIAFTTDPGGIRFHVSDLDSFVSTKAYVDEVALPADESRRLIHDAMESFR